MFFIILIVFTFCGANFASGQSASVSERSISKQNRKRFNIYYHLGSVELPEGYKGYCTVNWTDAWAGYIQSPDGNFYINWSAGLVEQLSNKYKNEIVWTKTEETPNFPIKFGLVQVGKDKQEILIAKTQWLEFSAVIKTEVDKDMFMEIVRSFQKERCDICRTFPIQTNPSNK